MKIVFNLPINVNYYQIYDELSKNHEIILPDNYKQTDTSKVNYSVDLNALERAVESTDDIDFILGFEGEISELIRWRNRDIDLPLVIYCSNTVNRPNLAVMSLYSNIWYVEKYATPLMEMYNSKNIIYAGMAANQYIFHPLNVEKKYDIGFFGQFYGERRYWLTTIERFSKSNNFKTHFLYGHTSKIRLSWEDLNEIYNQIKINLSFAPPEPGGRIVNMRTFEICMTGNFQLMEYTPCLEEYFEIDEEVVCWRNKKELLDKITYYIENDDEREKIAKKGFKRAIENHTWSNRVETINQFLTEKKQKLRSAGDNKIQINKFQMTRDCDANKQLELYKVENILSKVVRPILKNLGYNIRRNLKQKKGFIIESNNRVILFKPKLKGYFFIEFYGKIMMIIQIIPHDKEINLNDWEDLKKIRMLIDNFDYDMPHIGIITNGLDWLIKDLKNNKWLRSIPTYQKLNSRVKFKDQFLFRLNYHLNKAKIFSIIFRIPYNKYFFKVFYHLPNLNSILKFSKNYRRLKYLMKSGILNRYIYANEITLLSLLEKKVEIFNDLVLKNKTSEI